ncbi:MAG: transposase [Bryobacteraceae bacterium]
MQTFETEMLAEGENFRSLAHINRELISKVEAVSSSQRVVPDMDSTEIPVYGQQEQSAYNGHFESTCYHPLLLFNREGDCLAAKLRPGNVHSADDWEELLLPEIERQQKLGKEVVFRADAFAKPDVYDALEERGVNYAIRIPANDSLECDIAELLTRPVGWRTGPGSPCTDVGFEAAAVSKLSGEESSKLRLQWRGTTSAGFAFRSFSGVSAHKALAARLRYSRVEGARLVERLAGRLGPSFLCRHGEFLGDVLVRVPPHVLEGS